MRIRKHAKISPLLYAASSSVLQTTICQLNQSPWDVVTFDEYSPSTTTPPPPPPPPFLHHQVEEENSFPENGSFSDSIGAVESGNVAAAEGAECDFVDVEMEEVKAESSQEEAGKMVEEEIFCSKIDSKGWQCHRIAKSGYTLCEHHLSRLNKYNAYNNLAQENGTRESDKSIEHRRRGKPKKASASKDSSGYYYYSGFGPSWGGKRRGAKLSSCHNNNDNASCRNDGSSINLSNFETPGIEGGDTLGTKSRIGYGELGYMVEEEEDEDEDDVGGSGKKRARKPIKARSLKSLM